jgi:hypothetical protein
MKSKMCLLAALLLGIGAPPASSSAINASQRDSDALIQPFTGDVFVIVGVTLRNPTAETSDDAHLFNVAGVPLGVTWGEFRSAAASSIVRCAGSADHPRSDVRIQFVGLIPGGVYSVFYGTLEPDSENPLCPGVERTLPLTAFRPHRQMPDASSFRADANGEADYHGRLDGCLLDPSQLFFSVIYHFDGMAYHPLPNRGEFLTQGTGCRSSFGEDAMRQFLILQKGFSQ